MSFGWFVIIFCVGLFFVHFPRTRIVGWVCICGGAGLIASTVAVALGFIVGALAR